MFGVKRKSIKRVALALRLSFASHRDIIYGISQYAKSHHWQLVFAAAQDQHAEDKLQMAVPPDVDGFISSESYGDSLAACAHDTTHPLVILCQSIIPPRQPPRPLGLVGIDDRAIGAYGAEYLHSLGHFRSFGFVPPNRHHSSLRGRGFISFLRKKSAELHYYPAQSTKDGSPEDKQALAEWLKNLPKPAAVMATYDLRANHVLEAAHMARLSIPKQLVIIGVDNDELLCDFTDPPLSSVAPDFVHIGDLAAQTLAKLMSRRNKRQVILAHSDSKRIVERESTAHIAPSVRLVERALVYIRRNALSGISTKDVISSLGVSRRLADRRFREITGQSVLETILAQRLEAVQRKLASSRLTIRAITATCGFRSENYAKNLFKKRFGMSMKEYKAIHGPRRDRQSSPSDANDLHVAK